MGSADTTLAQWVWFPLTLPPAGDNFGPWWQSRLKPGQNPSPPMKPMLVELQLGGHEVWRGDGVCPDGTHAEAGSLVCLTRRADAAP